MPDFTVGKYLATRFEQIGLKHYFMVPGDYNLVLLDELLAVKNVAQIGCCNELNASYAAEGYARVNPKFPLSQPAECSVVPATRQNMSAQRLSVVMYIGVS